MAKANRRIRAVSGFIQFPISYAHHSDPSAQRLGLRRALCARRLGQPDRVPGSSRATAEPDVLLFINFFSMPEVDDNHDKPLMVGFVEDAVAAESV